MKVLIIGGGQVGEYLARLMLENGCSVKIIDNRESVIKKLKAKLPEDVIYHGNGTDPSLMEACGIADADVVAAVTGEDESNLVASTIAKFEFNVPRVIARVNNPENSWLFNAGMGVDAAINQADLMAHLVLDEIDLKNVLTLMKLNRGKRSIVKITVGDNSIAANKQLKDIEMPPECLVIAVYRGEEVIVPRGNTKIMGGDGILAFINNESSKILDGIFCC